MTDSTAMVLAMAAIEECKVISTKLDKTLEPTFVQVLPVVGESNKLYFLAKSDPEEGDYCEEYIWDSINARYERVGATAIDLSSYQTKTDNDLQTTDKTVVGAINETVGMVNTVDSTLDAVAEPLINQWDEEWEIGTIDITTGEPGSALLGNIRSKNFCPCKPSANYYKVLKNGKKVWLYYYDSNKVFIEQGGEGGSNNISKSPNNAKYFKVVSNVESYNNDISINYPASYTEYYPSRFTKYENSRSNRNLLDNPWFTVNQRGQTTYTSYQYTADRWYVGYGSGGVTTTVNNNGINVVAEQHAYLSQYLESELADSLHNKIVTISFITQSGSVFSGSFIFNKDRSAIDLLVLNGIHIRQFKNNSNVNVLELRSEGTNPISLRAIKLELGSVSTLANDTIPNYAEELLKCQRYYYRLQGDYLHLGCGEIRSTTTCYIGIQLPVTMRTIPTLSTNIQNSNYCRIYSNGAINNPVSASIVTTKNNNIVGVNFQTSSAVLTANQVAVVCLNDNNAYIEFSADL